MENARLITETHEALEQQTATAEVLGVINSSPGDLAPVFGAMLEKATRLCDAAFGIMSTWDGERFHRVAFQGASAELIDALRTPNKPITGSMAAEQLFKGEGTIHAADIREQGAYQAGAPVVRALVDIGGARSYAMVSLNKDDDLLGAITVYRREIRPFSHKQIALLQNFAAQAVIAMENARLFTETREALEQQTATADVLQVINSSPGDLAPVFDAMLEKALRLCDAAFGFMAALNGELVHVVAERGIPSELSEYHRDPYPVVPGTPMYRFLQGAEVIQIDDAVNDPETWSGASPRRRPYVELGGARSILAVPLRKDGSVLGCFIIYRQQTQAFSDKQIALLQNFAAQAVIAIENARLITETREALEQQTATAEVLGVINSSPGDLAPVFDAMLEKATRLCEAVFGTLSIWDGERFHWVAFRGLPTELVEALQQLAMIPVGDRRPVADRIVRGEMVISMPDLREAEHRGVPVAQAFLRHGARSCVTVALRKEERLLGLITIYREEVRPFSDKQIALLQNFAAQAVIAMENARLITETREALEQQTATAEVLQVINSSPGDLAPVFAAILEKAHSLCGATLGTLALFDGETLRAAAVHGYPEELAEELRRGIRVPQSLPLLAGARLAHYPDLRDLDEPFARDLAERGGVRTNLLLPLRKDGVLLGLITCNRQEVRPFSEKQITLLENFAAQAVIAMENARLLTETREALEQQQAIAEILQVINRSPGDLGPVFDAILEKAHALCGVTRGSLQLYDGEKFRAVAVHGLPEPFAERLRQGYTPSLNLPNQRLLDGERVVQIHDWAEIDDPMARSAVELGGVRTVLCVALRKDDVFLGLIAAARPQVRPFSEKEIALLESFAAQAVIAMDNARLLNEIRQRQAELRVTFDNMGDGVAMFDSDQRLAAWNLNFQRILELPDALLAERLRVEEFARYLATHGEYGAVDVEAEVRRLSERVGTQWSAERTRPDGRVIEVRSNPVPGGGVVLIYSDVTERKRAEEEIRAARDTAEKALQELQTAQASLLHAQKMAALGQLTAGIAHEIKNPLNFVNNFAELSGELLLELKETTAPAVAALGDDERAAVGEVVEMLRGNLDKIAEHGKRADGIVKSMLEHSRGVSGERRVISTR